MCVTNRGVEFALPRQFAAALRRGMAHLTLGLSLILTTASLTAPPLRAAYATPGFTETIMVGSLIRPSSMEIAPDGRFFITLQGGEIRILENGVLLPTPFATLPTVANEEEGLLGLTFDPAFPTNGYLYVYYTAQTPARHNRVSRLTANGNVAVPGSETYVYELDNRTNNIHAGGGLHFGPDGKLYIGSGDGGMGINSQNLTTTHGKLLRINSNGSIPGDNPFLGSTTGKYQAIWARGLRNPFTFDFQPGTGLMYLNDVGAANWEEVDRGIAGANYGWPFVEGPSSNPSYTPPIHYYSHAEGCGITGGAFYNPPAAVYPASYVGKYFYADFCAGRVRTIDPASPLVYNDLLTTTIPGPVDVRLGLEGQIYYLGRGGFGGGGDTSAIGSLVRISYQMGDAPVVTVQPADRAISLGAQATFSVAVTGAPPLSCQWWKNGAPIAGATNFSYTTPATLLADDGAQFRCDVTNGSATISSTIATLSLYADSVEVVNWGGNYTATSQSLRDTNLPVETGVDLGGGYTGARWYVPYSNTTPLSVGLPGPSATFYGGILFLNYLNSLPIRVADIWDQGAADAQRSNSSIGTLGWDLRYWQKADFLNDGVHGSVTFGPGSRLELQNYRAGNGQPLSNSGYARFVVRDGSTFWISEDAAGPADTLGASFVLTNPGNRRWASLTVAPPYAIQFNPAGATFQWRYFKNITALGYLHTNVNVPPPATGVRAGFACDRFRVVARLSATSGVEDPAGGLPDVRYLEANRPNPFRASTTIDYALPAAGPVRITLYDVAGRQVRTLLDAEQAAGPHRLTLSSRDLPAGTYFYSMSAAGRVETRKLQIVR